MWCQWSAVPGMWSSCFSVAEEPVFLERFFPPPSLRGLVLKPSHVLIHKWDTVCQRQRGWPIQAVVHMPHLLSERQLITCAWVFVCPICRRLGSFLTNVTQSLGYGPRQRSQTVTTPHCSCGTTQISRAWGAPPTDSVLEPELDTPQSQVKGGWLLLVCHFLDALQTF